LLALSDIYGNLNPRISKRPAKKSLHEAASGL
jgi:hypothetical protein